MRSQRNTGIGLVAVLVLLLTGCSVLPEPRPPVSYDHYTLAPAPADEAAAQARVPLTLLLPPPRIRGELAGTQMAYRQTPGRLEFFARSRWAEAPQRLLHDLLLERFTREGPYAYVVREATPAAADHRLEIEVLDFIQDFTVTPSRFRVRLRWQLLDLDNRRVRLQELIEAEVPAPTDSPQGGAAAAAAAVNELFERIQRRLERELRPDA